MSFSCCWQFPRIRDYAREDDSGRSLIAAYACISGRWICSLFTSHRILITDYVQENGGFERLQSTSRFRTLFWASILSSGFSSLATPEQQRYFFVVLAGSPWNVFAALTPKAHRCSTRTASDFGGLGAGCSSF